MSSLRKQGSMGAHARCRANRSIGPMGPRFRGDDGVGMSLTAALRAPPIRLLWLGQILSSIGDQFYLVAVLWLALDLVGHDAGFISAGNAAAVFAVALTAGAWADRWDARRTMFW